MSVLTLLPKPHKPPSALVQLCVVIRRLEDILEMKENTRAMYLRDLVRGLLNQRPVNALGPLGRALLGACCEIVRAR